MSIYDGIIEVGKDGQPIEPILVLSSRGGNKIGIIQNVASIEQTHPLSDVAELSFDVYKYANGDLYRDWDKLKDFKLVQIPRENTWFEAKVSVDEEDELIKHVTCVHANEAELGQLNLYETEINTEADIDRDNYKETFFYNEEDPDASLLHRILKDKAPHYQIYHVDISLRGLFRQFSFNGVSIQEALNQIAEECNCVFVYGEWGQNDGKYHRTISAYDLEDYCYHCGKRGNYTEGHCTNCGSTNLHYGYGEDTGIFVSIENLAKSISYETNTDEVKNCFRLSAGDDVMTSAIKSCNPTMSQYIWYFSEDMLEDMSDGLAEKIIEYNGLVEEYRTEREVDISSSLLSEYNSLVETYKDYKEDLVEIDDPIVGTAKLIEAYYNAINLYGFLKSELSPASEEVTTTSAIEQMEILQTGDNMSEVGISDASGTIAYTTANSAIASYAKVYIDTSRYKVTVFTDDIDGTTWSGTITLTSYTDDEDTDTEEFEITLFDGTQTGRYTQWLEQSVQKAMANKEATNLNIVDLFDTEESVSDFAEKLTLYSLDSLSMMGSMATTAITIMVEQGVASNDASVSDVYSQLYVPYYEKGMAIENEITTRELQLSYLLQPTDDEGNTDPRYPSLGLLDEIINKQNEIATLLNMQTYLGDELWEELSFYRRENEYQNPNYISDGLTDSEIIEYAQRFYDEASKEIVKSATLQHTISAPLKDFLLMEEFYPLQSKFKTGNWIRLKVDGKIFKLRLANWTIGYDKIEDLDVDFTDVVRCGNIISDTQSILSKSRSMSTTYGFVSRQADKGKYAADTLQVYKDSGIDFSKIKAIISKGNTNIVYDDDGILLKRVDGVEVLPEQARIYNNGIYITRDAWETVSTGLGHYSYVDPETGETVQTYGIIADTVIGKLILGDKLKIYSESNTLEMGDDGLVVTAKPSAENEDLFVLQKKDSQGNITKYIYVDSDGNVRINGSTIITSGDGNYSVDDARKHATNYLSTDGTGVMVANMTDGNTYEPSDIPTGNKNVLITDSDVKIRDGQTQLASYGNIIKLGKDDENNIQITSNTFKGVKTIHGASTSTDIEVFNMTVGDNRVVELSDVAQKHEGSSSVGVTLHPSHEFNEQDTLTMYGIILFEDGVSRETQRFYRQYDANDESGEIIGDIIEFTWLDDDGVRQTLSCSLDYMLNDTTSTFYANDTYTTDKISSIQLALIYVEDESYPYYRFGIHNSDDIFYDEGNFSFDIGENNVVAGSHAFAHGIDNSVQGVCGFANGGNCSVTGDYANANGKDCVAQGDYSTVNGVGNVARYEGQTVIGKYAPLSTSDDLFIAGNGTSESDRSYAMRLKSNGRVEFKGAVGTGLAWDSRTEMIQVVGELSLNKPYNFFATSRNTGSGTIYWSTVAGAEDSANAFGSICKMSTTTWQIYFMCSGKFYTSVFNLNTTDPTQSTFATNKLLTQADTANFLTQADVVNLLRQYNLIS